MGTDLSQLDDVAGHGEHDERHDDDAQQSRHAQQRALFAREHDASGGGATRTARDVLDARGYDESDDDDDGDEEGEEDVDDSEDVQD